MKEEVDFVYIPRTSFSRYKWYFFKVKIFSLILKTFREL